MLRLVIAIAVVATIFMHSPARPPESLTSDLLALKDRTQASLIAAASRSPLAQSIAESALRRTLSDETPPPPSTRDERAAALGHRP